MVPFGFSLFFCFRIGFERKTKGKLLENQSQPTPGPLRSFLLSLSLLWPPGLLWLALAPSFLSLSSFTRNKEEIRLWGLSGASVWALCLFSFTRYGERRIPYGLLWTCSGSLLSLFLLLSLLWGSFSGTSPESLLVVWPPRGSSGWLWPPPSSLCLLLRVIRKKSDSGASLELPSGHLPPLSSLGSSGMPDESPGQGAPEQAE